MAEKRKNGPHGPGGPGPRDFRKPKNAGRTISTLLGYVGKSKWLLGVVAVCLVLNVGCSIGGSYMLRPLINDCIIPGDYPRLARMLAVLAGIYVCAALLSYTYARIHGPCLPEDDPRHPAGPLCQDAAPASELF